MRFLRLSILSLALAAAFLLMVDASDARVGSGNSSGSRGSRTFNSAPPTNTAPKAAPVERSMTQPGAPIAAQGANQPATATAPSRFGGFGGLLMGEVWTFRRDDRDPEQGWHLSAIQQVECT